MTDYQQLEQLLAKQLWQDADAETGQLMWTTVRKLRLEEPGLSKTERKQLQGLL